MKRKINPKMRMLLSFLVIIALAIPLSMNLGCTNTCKLDNGDEDCKMASFKYLDTFYPFTLSEEQYGGLKCIEDPKKNRPPEQKEDLDHDGLCVSAERRVCDDDIDCGLLHFGSTDDPVLRCDVDIVFPDIKRCFDVDFCRAKGNLCDELYADECCSEVCEKPTDGIGKCPDKCRKTHEGTCKTNYDSSGDDLLPGGTPCCGGYCVTVFGLDKCGCEDGPSGDYYCEKVYSTSGEKGEFRINNDPLKERPYCIDKYYECQNHCLRCDRYKTINTGPVGPNNPNIGCTKEKPYCACASWLDCCQAYCSNIPAVYPQGQQSSSHTCPDATLATPCSDCQSVNQFCVADSDCCGTNLKCVLGRCMECEWAGTSCTFTADCCEGLICDPDSERCKDPNCLGVGATCSDGSFCCSGHCMWGACGCDEFNPCPPGSYCNAYICVPSS